MPLFFSVPFPLLFFLEGILLFSSSSQVAGIQLYFAPYKGWILIITIHIQFAFFPSHEESCRRGNRVSYVIDYYTCVSPLYTIDGEQRALASYPRFNRVEIPCQTSHPSHP